MLGKFNLIFNAMPFHYIPAGEGWLYLAVVKDLCTKKVVGYAFSSRIDTLLTLAGPYAVSGQSPG